MNNKVKYGILFPVLIVSFGIGRYSAPEKVRTETKIVEVEKKSTKKEVDTDKHKETKVVEVINPDGTKTTTTIIVEDTDQKKKETDKSSRKSNYDTVSEVSRSGSRISLSALAGSDLRNLHALVPVYGVAANKELLGPITVGVFGMSNGLAGVSLGLNF